MNITKMFDNNDFLQEHPQPKVIPTGYLSSYLYNIELKLQKLYPDMKFRDYTENSNRHFNQNNLVGLGNNITEKLYWLTVKVVDQDERIKKLEEEISKLEDLNNGRK